MSLWALAAASALAGSGPCEATILPPRPDISEAAQRRRELYGPVVIAAACRHGIPPLLLDALVTQESRYDPTRVSPKGAMGLGQLMPGTARELGVANPFDPAQNANGSARYLAALFDQFGTPKLALAAYNAGARRVRDAGGVPPFAETIGYVAIVEGGWRRAEAARPVPAPPAGAPWTPRSVGKILTDAFGGVVTDTWRPMSPYHTFPVGKRSDNHWGPAVCMLKTESRSPYYFNFHVADIGHTLIIGPTGAGKTVLLNFLLSQAEKLGARQFLVDKDRGAEIYVRAAGGTYLTLQNGRPTGFAPLKALGMDPRGRSWLGKWLRLLVSDPGQRLSSQDEDALDAALSALERIPQEERSLSVLRSMLPSTKLEGIGPRLDRWCEGGEYGWVFDGERDELSLDVKLAGFDMTDFLENDFIRPSVMSYLFERIDMVIDGRPAIIVIDEFWKALGDPGFTSFAQDGLKTYRKRNAMMLFATQSPVDALRASISHTIIEQCSTKILLPNPGAQREQYVEGLAISEKEFELIKTKLSAESRRFLVKQGHNSVVAELDLGAMDNALAVLSGRASTVELVSRLREELGDDPAVWLPRFHAERGGLR